MEEIEPPVSDTEYRRESGLLSDEELLKDREGDIEDEGIPWNEAFPASEEGVKENAATEPAQQEKAIETEKAEKMMQKTRKTLRKIRKVGKKHRLFVKSISMTTQKAFQAVKVR